MVVTSPPSPYRAGRNNPIAGALYFLRGLRLIVQPGIRRYVAVPLLINFTAFAVLIYFGIDQIDRTLEALLPAWLDWLEWLLLPMFLVVCLIAAFFAFNLVANLIAAPFNGLLADAVERHLTGATGDGEGGKGFGGLMRELVASVRSEIVKLAYIAVRTVPLLLLLLVPGLNVVASIALMGLSAWMLVIAYADYPMANHGLTFAEQRRRLGARRFLGLGFGASVMVALAIPVLNFVVIPCAVAGATAMWVEVLAHDDPR